MFCPAGECPFAGDCADRIARAAAVYAALGYAVYPAGPTSQAHHRHLGQFERGQGGFRLATTDLAVVTRGRDGAEDWAEAWRMPGTAIGIATGLPSRLLVIDIDPDIATVADAKTLGETFVPDEKPAQRVREWAAEHGVLLPGNVIASTPSGAGRQHVWVRMPEGWETPVPRQLGWFEHVDLCADGHSVKAPPSVRPTTEEKPGGQYTFTRGCPCTVPVADEPLLRAILATPATAPPARRVDRNGSESGDGEEDDGPIDVETLAETGVETNQNFVFKKMACSMLAHGWDWRVNDSTTPANVVVDKLMEAATNSPTTKENWPWTRSDMVKIERAAREFLAADRRAETARNQQYVANMGVRRFR